MTDLSDSPPLAFRIAAHCRVCGKPVVASYELGGIAVFDLLEGDGDEPHRCPGAAVLLWMRVHMKSAASRDGGHS